MFKVNFTAGTRIIAAQPETQETAVQQKVEVNQIPKSKPVTMDGGPMRSESMMSSIALRAQLNQLLANQTFTRSREQVNAESLKNVEQIEQQALTQEEAEQQISYQPSLVKPFSRDEASIKGQPLPRTLYTGDGDDNVNIQWSPFDELYHVYVNDKETWSGNAEQLQNLTINTGSGNDRIYNTTLDPQNDGFYKPVDGVTILTGDGDDNVSVDGSRMKIDTGRGRDQVGTSGDDNIISVGEGNDWVQSYGDRNQINTGGQQDDFAAAHGKDNLVDGKEPEIPDFPELKW